MKKSRRQIAREQAIIGIYQHLLVDNTIEDIYGFLSENDVLLNDEDLMRFSKWLVKTTIDNYQSYRMLIEKYLKKGWTIDRISKMEQAILLIAVCEILESDLDEKIVINEAVINAKEFCDEDSYKFINGVLHKIV
ncbi:MAG: transcription antitermination factor NusB [Bacilli bacterium]|nr:transcription antitermination factor NusB [Bacilli bacterium]